MANTAVVITYRRVLVVPDDPVKATSVLADLRTRFDALTAEQAEENTSSSIEAVKCWNADFDKDSSFRLQIGRHPYSVSGSTVP
jgi:hypothetical protein